MNSRIGRSALLLLTVAFAVVGCASGKPDDQGASGGAAAEEERLVGKSATLIVYGLACPSCAASVERQLMQTPGVTACDVDVGNNLVTLALDPNHPPTQKQVKDAVKYGGAVLVELRQP